MEGRAAAAAGCGLREVAAPCDSMAAQNGSPWKRSPWERWESQRCATSARCSWVSGGSCSAAGGRRWSAAVAAWPGGCGASSRLRSSVGATSTRAHCCGGWQVGATLPGWAALCAAPPAKVLQRLPPVRMRACHPCPHHCPSAEAVCYPPALLPSSFLRWEPCREDLQHSAVAVVEWKGVRASATLSFDGEGRFLELRSRDYWRVMPDGRVAQFPWRARGSNHKRFWCGGCEAAGCARTPSLWTLLKQRAVHSCAAGSATAAPGWRFPRTSRLPGWRRTEASSRTCATMFGRSWHAERLHLTCNHVCHCLSIMSGAPAKAGSADAGRGERPPAHTTLIRGLRLASPLPHRRSAYLRWP